MVRLPAQLVARLPTGVPARLLSREPARDAAARFASAAYPGRDPACAGSASTSGRSTACNRLVMLAERTAVLPAGASATVGVGALSFPRRSRAVGGGGGTAAGTGGGARTRRAGDAWSADLGVRASAAAGGGPVGASAGSAAGCCCCCHRRGCDGCGADRADVEADAASARALFLGGRADAGCDADEDRVMALLCDSSGMITASISSFVDDGAASLSACAPSGVRPSHRLKSRRNNVPPRRISMSAGTADSSSTDERRLSSVSPARVCRCSAESMCAARSTRACFSSSNAPPQGP